MRASSLAAIGCFVAAGGSLLAGEAAFVEARDLPALYWIVTGAVSLRASMALARKRAP